MKRLLYLIALIALLCTMQSCCKKFYAPSIVETRDSVRVETKVIVKTEKDTVYIEVPAQSAERTTQDSTSHLETDFATSDARIEQDGSLYHDLKNKPQKRPAETEKQIIERDSIIYRDREVEVPVPVERELTWWEHTSIKWFPYSLAALLIILAYIFRKPLLAVIRRFI